MNSWDKKGKPHLTRHAPTATKIIRGLTAALILAARAGGGAQSEVCSGERSRKPAEASLAMHTSVLNEAGVSL